MGNRAKIFWCPNCFRRFEKDDAILTLTSHIAIVGEGINWSGDLEKDIHTAKRVMYCKACGGPIDFHALLRGNLDYRAYSIEASFWAFLLTVLFGPADTFWAAFGLALIVAIPVGIAFNWFEKRHVARWRLSESDVRQLRP